MSNFSRVDGIRCLVNCSRRRERRKWKLTSTPRSFLLEPPPAKLFARAYEWSTFARQPHARLLEVRDLDSFSWKRICMAIEKLPKLPFQFGQDLLTHRLSTGVSRRPPAENLPPVVRKPR